MQKSACLFGSPAMADILQEESHLQLAVLRAGSQAKAVRVSGCSFSFLGQVAQSVLRGWAITGFQAVLTVDIGNAVASCMRLPMRTPVGILHTGNAQLPLETPCTPRPPAPTVTTVGSLPGWNSIARRVSVRKF